ncbi:GntR family transcriptional regulator [Actinoalloteichus hymeniacidonis]|uniref:GntR family transcriptional regulator n=1 Tax=Actinoalloteichus hymeniacidonis TaxID=340345 RepID=UPI00180C361F|nr:GntR family transcriptional regulator [Actinoalloteichus hymeniacidonis]MBB5910490.1 DNA-binding GntR family transcriptional regulator [Actinoalloteichus hymeniacidonis]
MLEHIRNQIIDGTLAPGASVPSERQIVVDWEVSRSTATKVLAALRADGLVESIQGVGTIVRAAALRPESPQDRFARARRTGKIYGPDEYAKITEASLAAASAYLADVFGIDEGRDLIRRVRVTYRGDSPISLSTSWFDASHAETAPALLTTERIKGGTAAYLEQTANLVIARGRDDKSARTATTEDSEALGVPIGSPVLAGRNTVWTEDGVVIEYGESVRPANHWASTSWLLD